MGRHDGTRIGIGSALLGIGFAGVLALLIYASEADRSNDPSAVCGEWWYRGTIAIAVAMAVIGAYFLAAVWFGWPTWSTAIERSFEPRLVNTTVEAHRIVAPDYVVVKVGTINAGRGNVENAMLNVVVPDFVTEIERCDENGGTGHPHHMGIYSHTTESIIPYQPNRGSIYWNGNVSFPGRVARIVYFRMRKPGMRHDFALRLQITSPEFEEPVYEMFHVRVSHLTP